MRAHHARVGLVFVRVTAIGGSELRGQGPQVALGVAALVALVACLLTASCGGAPSNHATTEDNPQACKDAEEALGMLPPSSELTPGPQQPALDKVAKGLRDAADSSVGDVHDAIESAYNAVEDAELTLLKGNALTQKEAAALDGASVAVANGGCSP